MVNKIKLICIVGPTASGKTALSVELAKRLGGEVVSCDSMQIYRGMDIGSAKPTTDEMCGIPHHMLDIADPGDSFSCADYTAMAAECIADIASRGRLPIVCGGTGLYLDSLLYSTEFGGDGGDEKVRAELEMLDCTELHRRLSEVDAESAEAIHPNNKKRVIRALELYLTTGVTKSEWDRRSRVKESRYEPFIICLDSRDREYLYDRINRRVDLMIADGLVEEARRFRHTGGTAAQAIGYKELWGYIDGEESLEVCTERLKQATRNYAKRQLTWFKRFDDCCRIYVDEFENCNNIVNSVMKHIYFSSFVL